MREKLTYKATFLGQSLGEIARFIERQTIVRRVFPANAYTFLFSFGTNCSINYNHVIPMFQLIDSLWKSTTFIKIAKTNLLFFEQIFPCNFYVFFST